jgi:hypothetical protein
LEELADWIVLRVVRLKPRDAMLDDLADVIWLRLDHHEPICSGERKKEVGELIWEDPEFRHALVLALFARSGHARSTWWLSHADPRLVDRTDRTWLLAWLATGQRSETAQKCCAEILQRLVDWNDAGQVDEVLSATYNNELIHTLFAEWVDPIALDSPRAAELRTNHERQQAFEAELSDRSDRRARKLDPPPAERVRNTLARCEIGDTDGFWLLTLELSLEPTSRHYQEEFGSDLTQLPGWREADSTTRDRIVSAAQRYLRERDPQPERWLGTNVWHRPAFAGYRALRLIAGESPAYLIQIRPEEWARWAPVVVAFPFVNEKGEQAFQSLLLREAYRFAPAAVLQALGRVIDRDNEEHGYVFGLEKFDSCWDEGLSNLMLAKCAEPGIKVEAFRAMLGAALTHGSVEAIVRARSLLQLPIPQDEEHRSKAVAAASLLLDLVPNEAWDEVWSAVEADEAFGIEVISSVARSGNRGGVHALSENRLATLYVWISRRFPHGDDRDDRGEAYFVGPLDQIRWFRDGILNTLKEQGTFEAVRALQWVADMLPELEWLRYAVHTAQANARSKTWDPPSPTDILRLGGLRDGRFVRNGSELLDVVVSSLKRLEAKLQAETPAVIDLWNGPDAQKLYSPKDENALSNYVKRHLEADLTGRGVVVNREVEIRRGEGKARGETTDVHVNAIARESPGRPADVVTVIIEAKGCWNRELNTAMDTQLVGRYLKDNACRHGLYLVGWYNCPQWDPADDRRRQCLKVSLDEARKRFDTQARGLSIHDLEVRAVVLNSALRSA